MTSKYKYPTADELTMICKKIDPNSKAPLLLGSVGIYANWIQYFDYYKQRSNEATEKDFAKMPFLDTRLVNLLAKINDSTHFNFLKAVTTMPISNKDLTSFQSTLSNYFDLIKQLETYADKKLKDYA